MDLSLVFWFLVLFPCLWIRGDLNHLSYDRKHHHVRRTGKPQDHQTVFAAVHSLTLTGSIHLEDTQIQLNQVQTGNQFS